MIERNNNLYCGSVDVQNTQISDMSVPKEEERGPRHDVRLVE